MRQVQSVRPSGRMCEKSSGLSRRDKRKQPNVSTLGTQVEDHTSPEGTAERVSSDGGTVVSINGGIFKERAHSLARRVLDCQELSIRVSFVDDYAQKIHLS